MRVKGSVRGRISAQLRWRSYSTGLRASVIVILCLSVVGISLLALHTTRAAPPCPCNVFTASQPTIEPGLFSEPGGIEVGFKFKTDQSGYISGIRFYKVAGMSGTHTATLWNQYGVPMAQATFTSESAAGWQQVDFSPVAVAPNTLYTASVFMTDGQYAATTNYFTADINNSPLIVPKDGTALDWSGHTGQGVYGASTVSEYPTGSYHAGNYWIDVSYVGSATMTAPSITATTPTNGATNITAYDNEVTATFNTVIDPATVTASSFVVKDAANHAVSGTVSYDSTTHRVHFTADAPWQIATTYTATLIGGSNPSAILDMQGRALPVDYVWTFSSRATVQTCPCSLRNEQNPSGSTSYRDTSFTNGIELGTKVVALQNGYITALRFYKPIINPDTTHDGHVWDANGDNLASVTFTNESDYGWQEATLSTPLSVVRGQMYIVSYGTATPYYQAQAGSFMSPIYSSGLVAYPSGDSRNTNSTTGTSGAAYSSIKGTFPNTPGGTNADYYIDAVFALNASDVTPPRVTVTQPTDKSYGVNRTTEITATLDHALDGATVNSTSVKVYDKQSNLVAGTVTYDGGRRSIVFSPTTPLLYNTNYTINVSAGVKDVRGVNIANEYTWSFTTGSAISADMNQGNGGPILVVTTSGSAYGAYYAEILRTEGFNYFDVKDITAVSSAEISKYATVILSSMSLTQAQVNLLSSWVTDGGNLVAMRPDKKLSGLLGLTDAGSSATNQYLRTNVASAAGIGIVDETIQYKGTADNYTLSGAGVVASLYSDSTTPTLHPAATTHSVGSGTAMAFSYDLARSVIALHQGNQVWSGQDRNGDGVIRSTDLFYGQAAGDVQSDWLDSTKMAIPQADEQQRLLANMITNAMKKTLPAPRFWYLPDSQKAVLALAGDDHSLANKDGTEQTLNNWLNESATGCSVQDWQCIRASHYVYTTSDLTQSRATQYIADGFEIANHPSNFGTCNGYPTFTQLNSALAANLAAWKVKYPGLPNQKTSRYHCYLWGSWDMMPLADSANGIRYDLDTVAYPAGWVGTSSPLVTGSGMNMRLTDVNGAMIDVRQGVTNFDNTAAGVPAITATFDNALGTKGYYGIFGSHYDMTDDYYKTLVPIAESRNIPIISSEQALEWLDGRNSSNFSNLKSPRVGKETFTITAGEGAHGLQAMLPISDNAGTLATVTLAGQAVTYRIEIIKGVQYALFNAQPGDYDVTYSDYTAVVSPTSTSSGSSSTAIGQELKGVTTIKEIAPVVDPTTAEDISSQKSSVSKNQTTLRLTQPSDNKVVAGVPTPLVVIASVAVGVVVVGSGATFWVFRIRKLRP